MIVCVVYDIPATGEDNA